MSTTPSRSRLSQNASTWTASAKYYPSDFIIFIILPTHSLYLLFYINMAQPLNSQTLPLLSPIPLTLLPIAIVNQIHKDERRPMASPTAATIRYSLLKMLPSGVARLRLRLSTCVFRLCCVPSTLPVSPPSRGCCPPAATGSLVHYRTWSWRDSSLPTP
jgi:hypothetical protein